MCAEKDSYATLWRRTVIGMASLAVIAVSWMYFGFDAGNPRAIVYVGDVPLDVEVAQTDRARAKGLMFRESLATDSAMLFIYDEPGYLRFWMKDTPLDLDIGFFGPDGRLLQIEQMSADDEHTIHTADVPAKYALEVNRGWFTRNNILLGVRMRVEEREAVSRFYK